VCGFCSAENRVCSQLFGLNQAQVGEGIRGPCLHCVIKFLHGLGQTFIGISGRKQISFSVLSFLFFVTEKTEKSVKLPKIKFN
jgi:hypothetical protein